MTYTAATSLPALNYLQWATPTAPNPRLKSSIGPTDTTLYFTSAPLDHTGAVVTGNFLMGIKNAESYVETVYVPAGAMSVDGLTATGVVRGIRLEGTDYTTGDATLASSFDADSPVFCNISAVIEGLMVGVLKGTIATNGLGFIIGDGTATNATISHKDATGTHGFLRKNPTDGKVEYSDDGASWVSIDSATASNLLVVSNSDTTPSTLDAKLTVSGSGVTKTIVNPGGNESINLNITANGYVDVAYTAGEDLTANDLVSKTTFVDNTVELTVVNDLNTGSGETTWTTTGVDLVRACQAAAQKVAVFYRDTTNSLGKVVIGSVAPSTKVVTWGTPVSVGYDVGSTSICYMADNKIAVTWRSVGNNYVYLQIITISGTVPTIGTELNTQFTNTASAQGSTAVTCIGTDKVALAVRDAANSNYGYVAVATVVTTTPTLGTPVKFLTTGATNAVSNIAITKASTDKFVVFCRNEGDTNKGKGALGVVSGTTITMATEVEIDANASSEFNACYDGTTGGVVVWIGGVSGYVMSRVWKVTSLTLSYPAAAQTVNALVAVTPRVVYGSYTGAGVVYQSYVVYEETALSDGKFNKLIHDETSGAITVSAQYVLNGTTNNLAQTAIATVNGNNKFVIAYKDEADSNKGNAECFQDYDNTSRAVGFAQSSVASGAAVSVREKGLAANTGLTAGLTYYAGSTTGGAVSSTNTSGIKVGIAKTATSLDVAVQVSPVTTLQKNYTAGTTVWTKSKKLAYLDVQIWGGGGAGGTYASQAWGGGGGAYNFKRFYASELPDYLTVTIGAGGTATAAYGNVGGDSSFGTLLYAYGGGGGGNNSATQDTGGGGGQLSAGITRGTGGSPGFPQTGSGLYASANRNGDWGGGAGGSDTNFLTGGNSLYGGAGGGSGKSAGNAGGVSVFGGAGGAGATNGVAGSIPGGGGGGGNNGTGGAGGDGKGIVTEFYL